MQLILRMEQKLSLKEKIHTIPLFDEFDNMHSEGRIEVKNDSSVFVLKLDMTNILRNKLRQGKEQNKLINVAGFRCIGKTTELINFAKKNGYAAIVSNKELAEDCVRKYEYLSIYCLSDLRPRRFTTRNCVVDEGVDIDRVKNDLELNVIAGYVNKNNK